MKQCGLVSENQVPLNRLDHDDFPLIHLDSPKFSPQQLFELASRVEVLDVRVRITDSTSAQAPAGCLGVQGGSP